jgi:hypothetical protein
MGDLIVPVGFLIGDLNGDGAVNSGDAQIVRNRSGQVANSTNFRADVNRDGAINSGDAFVVRSRSGTGIPGFNHNVSQAPSAFFRVLHAREANSFPCNSRRRGSVLPADLRAGRSTAASQ